MNMETELGVTCARFTLLLLQTAEEVAKRYSISRERMDEYGARSQQRACATQEAGGFDAELAPITVTMAGMDKDSGRLYTKEVTVAAENLCVVRTGCEP